MGSTRMMVLFVVVVTCMVAAAPSAEALTCPQVASNMISCLGYLQKGGPLPPACCAGVKALNNAANTTPARQSACTCLKNIYRSNPGINVPRAAGLPGNCGVNVPYKIAPSTDCAKIH